MIILKYFGFGKLYEIFKIVKIFYFLIKYCTALSLRASIQLLSAGNGSERFKWETRNDTFMGGRSKVVGLWVKRIC